MAFGFFDVFIVIAVMLTLIIPGFVLRKLNFVDKSAIRPLVMVLLYVCMPFLTIKSFVLSEAEPSGELAVNMLIMFGFAFAVHIFAFLFLKPVFRSKDKLKNGALTLCSVFSNAGFIGIPFVKLLTGDDTAVIYAAVFSCAFNMLIWTLGVYIITGDVKMMSPLKGILNPAVIVLVIALPMFFIPQANIFVMPRLTMLGTAVQYLGDATLPISMLIVGIRMADIPLKSLFINWRLYVAAAAKLLFEPLMTFLLLLPFLLTGALNGIDPGRHIVIVLVILAAMPPAASCIAMAERFERDVDTAVKGYLLATLLSIITLPAVLTLLTKLIEIIP